MPVLYVSALFWIYEPLKFVNLFYTLSFYAESNVVHSHDCVLTNISLLPVVIWKRIIIKPYIDAFWMIIETDQTSLLKILRALNYP